MTPAEIAYQTSAEEDRNELVMQELSQVYYIASRIRERLPQHVELEDLVNAGVIGLLEASRSFDSTKNAQFKTFAKFRIRGAVLEQQDAQWRRGDHFFMLPGGGSLMSAQNTPSSFTALMNSWKSTGLTTYAFTPSV